MTVTGKSERASPYMSRANENRSRRGNERSRLSTLTRYGLASAASLVAFLASPRGSYAQVPTYEVTPEESSIKFGVESSVSIKGVFEKWNASIQFSSRDVRSAVLDIEIEAGSVNTGSHMKDNKLKGKDFFNVRRISINQFQVHQNRSDRPRDIARWKGIFTIRGTTKTRTHSHER